MGSCADRLHKLQKDIGLSDKELKAAVKRYAEPKEVKLPTFHEKVSKIEKKQQKIMSKVGKKRKYKMAYWYLEEYLDPREAREIYLTYLDFNELVDYAYQMVVNLVQLMTYVVDENPPIEKLIPPDPPGKYDIPVELEKEFNAYCKKHPIEKATDIIKRRKKFFKQRRKRRKKLYSKRKLRMYDPLFAANTINAKEMYKNLQRIGRENEIRTRRFHEMLEKLVEDKSIGSLAMKKFDERTEVLMEQHRKRLKQFEKQMSIPPNPVVYNFGNLFD